MLSFRLSAGFVVLAICQIGDCRPPEIRSVNLRGLQIGASTTVTFDGINLHPEPKIFLDDQPIDAVIDPTSTATRLIASIPVSASTICGIGQLRLATGEGISNVILVGLDRFPQLPLADETAAAQVGLHGSVPGSGISRTTFPGKAGEELIAEVEARRLGSKLRPVIHLYDSRRVQLAWASPMTSLASDTRLTVKLPRDDKYAIEIHDSQYSPPGPSFFRLRLGHWQFADLAFPPAIQRNQESTVQLLGNVAGAQTAIRAEGFDLLPVTDPFAQSFSGPPPSVAISSLPELVKSSDQPMLLPSIPIAVSGRLNSAGQIDRYLLPVAPGVKIIAEVFAERFGSRVDSILQIKKQGAVLVTNDDSTNTTDSRIEFTVPAESDSVEITVRDQLELADDAAIYRLVVSSASQLQPDFEVVLKGDAVNVPGEETSVVEAFVTRQSYDGPIQLKTEALPPGLQVVGSEVPAGTSGTLIGLSNVGGAAAPIVTKLIAQSPDGSIVRRVRIETAPDDKVPPWARERVGISAIAKSDAPFQMLYANDSTVTQFVLASKLTVPITIVRPPSTFGPVRLTLLVSQPQPKVNGQPNPGLSVRAEKPVEIAVDPAVLNAGNALAAIEKQYTESVQQAQAAQADAKAAADAKVNDLTMQRTAAAHALRAAESKSVYQADFVVIIPSVVGQTFCDLSMRAELLNPERNQVVRTTYLPIKRLPVISPISIRFESTSAIEATFDPKSGATIKLTGKLDRVPGHTADATIAVQGLPAGVTGPNVVVKSDTTDFISEIKIPATYAGPDQFALKFTATGPPDPLSGNIPVKSADVEVMFKLNRPAN